MFPFFHLFRQVAVIAFFPTVYLKCNLAQVSQGLYEEPEQKEEVNDKEHS